MRMRWKPSLERRCPFVASRLPQNQSMARDTLQSSRPQVSGRVGVKRKWGFINHDLLQHDLGFGLSGDMGGTQQQINDLSELPQELLQESPCISIDLTYRASRWGCDGPPVLRGAGGLFRPGYPRINRCPDTKSVFRDRKFLVELRLKGNEDL